MTRIDKTAPILTLSYSPNTATNQPVLVTLSTDEPVTRPAGWSGNATGTTFTKIYIQDVSEPVTIYDLVGNQGQKWLTIDWIDSTPVTGSVSYSTPLPTNGNVAATISFNKSGVVVTNNS
ncbi:hypothetical protein FACS1894176_04710 [Bacteroidia bacterium]|nr:hypothetical protein FACS1894176_04710 [Bacteroidia bacterium]